MLKLESIEIRYGDFVAVKGVNLSINKGEFFTLLGPSGCGKTTTLRAIAGLTLPSHGKILLNEQDISYQPAEKRNIGMVFQSYALFPTMTVFDNIAYGLKVAKVNREEIKQRVAEQAQLVDLDTTLLTKNVSQLSGGQQQRVAIARTLVTEPDLILFDEPLSNLDAKLREQLRGELKAIQARTNLTAVYVTHDQREALELSDRIAVFNKGEIQQVGTPSEIYNRSETEFVCNFVGDVNFLSENLVEWLNRQSDFKFDRSKRHYIRPENLHVHRYPSDNLSFTTTLTNKIFQGDVILYEVEAGPSTLRFMTLNQTLNTFQPGNSVTLSLDTASILSYEKGES
ncbi:ABC transporter ATP-binding protein [Facklamia sp. P12955]|uniref:ABC transporter ATP-binding protein n=1 Tax=unclassified Facklamia TaxID=2622293 RepID=UPI003D167E4C